MQAEAIFFPFDLFGSRGAASGAELLADAFEEMLDDTEKENMPSRASSYKDKVGFQEITFENLADYNDWKNQAAEAIQQTFADNQFLLWVSGNHVGTLPLYEEFGKKENALVVQFDAHLDVTNLTDCTDELSHGNFIRHCKPPLPKIINIGHRDLLLPKEHVEKYFAQTISTTQLARDESVVIETIRHAAQDASSVFFDLDCDVFDPAFFPAVAHPVPFGIPPAFLVRCIEQLWSDRVVGVSISEFCPIGDTNDRCLATLMWLLEYVLLKMFE